MANIQIVGIYTITSPSSKIYVGQSWNITTRWRAHRMKDQKYKNTPLQLSIKKYGLPAHKFQIAYELPKDVQQVVMDTYEQFFMDQYREAGVKLLNIKEGGSNGKMAEISKQRLSIVKSNPSEETRKRMREGSKRRVRHPHSEDTKRKMSVSGKLRVQVKKGVDCPNSKLSVDQVLEIRSLKGVMLQTEIARRFSVSTQLISSIMLRICWKHI